MIAKQLYSYRQSCCAAAEYMVDEDIVDDRLIAIFKEQLRTENSIFIIPPQLIHQSNRMSSFIEFTQSYFYKMVND